MKGLLCIFNDFSSHLCRFNLNKYSMACCSGGCGCGKKASDPIVEQIYFAQLPSTSGMLPSHDWMKGFPTLKPEEEIVEVRFKNSRKEFYSNRRLLSLKKDDRVVVDAGGGHDLGTITLTGDLARKNYQKKMNHQDPGELNQVYRIAKEADLENWLSARKKDHEALKRSREVARDLGLEMSISDVEFRGDGRKLTVFYTADGRVDFRELLKKYMHEFNVKIEMKQIGARQNAARTGGIGSCGRELCCSTWKTDISSVKTDSAKKQDLTMNASRLAGQCGKLKCCLNYELETYLEAWDSFPSELINIESDRGILKPINADVLKGMVNYSLEDSRNEIRYTISIDQVKQYISINKKGKLVETARIKAN